MMFRKLVSIASTFFVIAVLGVGVPLAGWGLDDLDGFFASPARLTYVIVVIFVAGMIALRIGGSPDNPLQRQGQEEKLDKRQTLTPILNRMLMIILYFLAPYCARQDILTISDAVWLPYIGLIIYLASLGLTYWAHVALDKQHSIQVTIQDDHQLIISGPYKWIRHPIYLATTFTPLGFSLLFVSWLGLSITAVILALFLWRIHDEERLLRCEFGEEWDTYCQQSRRLLPYIY